MDDSGDTMYGDSDFLADDDKSYRYFRENEKASKKEIVKQMVKLRHNLQYNKHLLSVYLKAKSIFDKMVEEHRAQIHHLDEIYRHLSKLIHEQLTNNKNKHKKNHTIYHDRKSSMADKPMIKELMKDKRNIGKLLSNMRRGLDKLMEIDTIIGTTIDKINEIQFIEDNERANEDKDDEEDDDVDDADYEDYDQDSSSSTVTSEEESDEDEDEESDENEYIAREEDDSEEEEDSAGEEEVDDEEEEEESEDSASEEDEVDDEEEEGEDSAREEEDEEDDEDSEDPVVFY
jgi:cobalamin biosynthesis protein CobT